jgi:hypothetical protein
MGAGGFGGGIDPQDIFKMFMSQGGMGHSHSHMGGGRGGHPGGFRFTF